MVSVADLKAKAGKAADATVSYGKNVKARNTSVPLAKTNWDPYSPQPVREAHSAPPPKPKNSSLYGPPPVSRNSRPDDVPSGPPSIARPASIASRFNSASATPPPVSSRPPAIPSRRPTVQQDEEPPVSSRPPAIPSRRQTVQQDEDEETRIDWANLSQEDKDVLFSWFDEFFSRFLGVEIPSRNNKTAASATPVRVVAPASRIMAPAPAKPGLGGPPPIATWSRPNVPSMNVQSKSTMDLSFSMSYPPETTYSSSAEDLAYYFHPSTHWDSAWYTTNDIIPPPIKGKGNMQCTGSWESINTSKTLNVAILFSDLSFCWASVAFSTAGHSDPNNSSAVRRHAEYLSRPSPMSGPALVEANETYGETIAAYAESFEHTNTFCARGECWDLANEGLKYFAQFDYVSTPIPSISRTHGHLIFEGKANGKGKGMVGRWRGGDDRVRRGDIVEWRSVKINTVGAPRGSYAILGDPEHTAIITRDSVPSRAAVDGQPLSPEDLGSLEVVEQSLPNGYPNKKTYDMSAFEEGEVWIYRCVPMEQYLGQGVQLVAKVPSGVRTMRV